MPVQLLTRQAIACFLFACYAQLRAILKINNWMMKNKMKIDVENPDNNKWYQLPIYLLVLRESAGERRKANISVAKSGGKEFINWKQPKYFQFALLYLRNKRKAINMLIKDMEAVF